MDQLVDLIFQGLVIVLIMIAQSKNSDTGAEIQIFLSFYVSQINTLAFFQNHRETVVGVKDHIL